MPILLVSSVANSCRSLSNSTADAEVLKAFVVHLNPSYNASGKVSL